MKCLDSLSPFESDQTALTFLFFCLVHQIQHPILRLGILPFSWKLLYICKQPNVFISIFTLIWYQKFSEKYSEFVVSGLVVWSDEICSRFYQILLIKRACYQSQSLLKQTQSKMHAFKFLNILIISYAKTKQKNIGNVILVIDIRPKINNLKRSHYIFILNWMNKSSSKMWYNFRKWFW